jgi:hypothetical protein
LAHWGLSSRESKCIVCLHRCDGETRFVCRIHWESRLLGRTFGGSKRRSENNIKIDVKGVMRDGRYL